MLGFEVAQSTVPKYMARPSKPPSQKPWRTFLQNHAAAIAAIDMCVVPTLTFDLLFAFLVLGHGRRQLLWVEVTRHPTAEWLARQITEAFPWTSAPAYLVRDNEGAYGHVFTSRLRACRHLHERLGRFWRARVEIDARSQWGANSDQSKSEPTQAKTAHQCWLSGVKRTWRVHCEMSAFDPKRTSLAQSAQAHRSVVTEKT